MDDGSLECSDCSDLVHVKEIMHSEEDVDTNLCFTCLWKRDEEKKHKSYGIYGKPPSIMCHSCGNFRSTYECQEKHCANHWGCQECFFISENVYCHDHGSEGLCSMCQSQYRVLKSEKISLKRRMLNKEFCETCAEKISVFKDTIFATLLPSDLLEEILSKL